MGYVPVKVGDRIAFTDPSSRITMDITIQELLPRGDEIVIKKAIVHSISGTSSTKLPEGWVYD